MTTPANLAVGRRGACGMLAAALLAVAAPAALAQGAGGAAVADLPTRPGVTVRTLTLAPAGTPRFAAILLVGGNGVNAIPDRADAAWTRDGSFLVRSSPLYRERGVYTVLVDVPTDHRGGMPTAFRNTREHLTDLAAVIADVRRRAPGLPVWLIGSSNGTRSASYAAALLRGERGPDGIVLTATVAQPFVSRSGPGMADIRVPTLLVHNRPDVCTPIAGAMALRGQLANAPRQDMLVFSSPPSPEASTCGLYGAHSFYGIEAEVTAAIVDWIVRHQS